MVPLKFFFVGYPRERISTGSGVPKAGFEPARVSRPPPQVRGNVTAESRGGTPRHPAVCYLKPMVNPYRPDAFVFVWTFMSLLKDICPL